MNSISEHITPASILALLRQFRSAKKEIVLIVEGDDDIALFSQCFGLSRNCFVSCFGKENLMAVFNEIPNRNVDRGMVFFRDADFDGISHRESYGIYLLVSDLYDFVMVIVDGRIYHRMFLEFLKRRGNIELAAKTFIRLVDAAAWVGALRAYSHRNAINLDFDKAEFGFVDKKTMEVDVEEMIRFIFARSHVQMHDATEVTTGIMRIRSESPSLNDLCCGKDFLEIFSICLCRHFSCCAHHAGSSEALARILRIATTLDDIKKMSLYPLLKNHVQEISIDFIWSGATL